MSYWWTKNRLPHDVPGWVGPDSAFLITICCENQGSNQLCVEGVGNEVLEGFRTYHELGRWTCGAAVLMPDHLHAVLWFPEPVADHMEASIAQWKSFQAKRLPIRWQSDFHDHRIRGIGALERKLDYVRENPVRAGLVERAEDWKWAWWPEGI